MSGLQNAIITVEEGEGLGKGASETVHKARVSFTVAAKVPIDADKDADMDHEAAVLAAIPVHPHIIACCGRAQSEGLQGQALLLELADFSLLEVIKCVPVPSQLPTWHELFF